VPVKEQAKPRRVDIAVGRQGQTPIEANATAESREFETAGSS
jgi:hypothetical protein